MNIDAKIYIAGGAAIHHMVNNTLNIYSAETLSIRNIYTSVSRVRHIEFIRRSLPDLCLIQTAIDV